MRTDPIVQAKVAAQERLDVEAGHDLDVYLQNVKRRVQRMLPKYGLSLHYAKLGGRPAYYPLEYESVGRGGQVAEDHARYGAPKAGSKKRRA